MVFHRTAIAVAAISAFSTTGIVHAQSTVPTTSSGPASEVEMRPIRVESKQDGYRAENVQSPNFTAPLRDTPRSVTVVTESLMKDTAANSLEDALRLVPGITFLAGEGGQALADRPVIRGFNSTSSVFIDGQRDIGDQSRDVFDLEAVEVIKGADSAYAGRGSGGGSINLVSKMAQVEDFGTGSITVGTADKFRATLDQNWQLGEDAGFRLGLLAEDSGVAGREDAVDYDKLGISPSATFNVSDATRITLDYYHLEEEGMPDYSIPYDLASGEPATETLGVNRKNFYGLVHRDFRKVEADIGTMLIEHDIRDDLRLRNVTRIGKTSNDYVVTNPDDSRGNVEDGFVFRNSKDRYSENTSYANQLDISGEHQAGGVGHRFNLGMELSSERRVDDGYDVHRGASAFGTDCSSRTLDPASGKRYGQLLFEAGDCTSLYSPTPRDAWLGNVERTNNPSRYRTDVAALYAFDTIELNDNWLVNAGLRLDHYESEVDVSSDPSENVKASDTMLNYQLGAVYKPIETTSYYASVATSSTPAPLAGNDSDEPAGDSVGRGGFNPANNDLEPEETTNLEIGGKWELFDQRVSLTAAAFHMTRDNAYVRTGPEDTDFAYAGKTRVQGIELGVSGQLNERWEVYGGYTYLDSKLVEGGFENDAEGKPLTNVPEHSLALFTSYTVSPELVVGGGVTYVSEVHGSFTADPPKKIPSYWRLDLNAAWQVSDQGTLRFNLLNVTDETYYTRAYASHYAALGQGRQALVTYEHRFR